MLQITRKGSAEATDTRATFGDQFGRHFGRHFGGHRVDWTHHFLKRLLRCREKFYHRFTSTLNISPDNLIM